MYKQKGNALLLSVIAILLLAAMATVGYLYYQNFTNAKKQADETKSTSNTGSRPNANSQTTDLTNSQIFDQVSSQLGLSRDRLTYFRIFGQDKVQYSTGQGTTFAYKISDTWKIAQENAQSIAICSEQAQVPEGYRPPCSESNSTSSVTLYLDADRRSINYPPSSMVSYIGQ